MTSDAALVDILGVRVRAQTLDGAIDTIGTWIDDDDPHYVCVTGVHGVVECHRDEHLRRIHNAAGMVTTDGMPLVWLARRRLSNGDADGEIERVYGPDLMLRTFDRSQATGWRHLLFGSSSVTLDRLAARLGEQFPRARVVGAHSPSAVDLDPDSDGDRAVVELITRWRPDIVWVGLSTPKQERWMAAHVGRVGAPVLVGVGAAFDFVAGVKRQAPPWMRRTGLEWAFRMATEPRRLAPRYLRNNPRFVWLVTREALRARRGQRAHT